MKEAISNSFLTTFILTIIIILILLVTGSLSYTKAFKVKNRIVNIVENAQTWDSNTVEQVDAALREIGYRVNVNNKQNCPARKGAIDNNDAVTDSAINSFGSNYRYCIYKYFTPKGYYYGVTAYMYFDIPLISSLLELPVSGETKIFYDVDIETKEGE